MYGESATGKARLYSAWHPQEYLAFVRWLNSQCVACPQIFTCWVKEHHRHFTKLRTHSISASGTDILPVIESAQGWKRSTERSNKDG